MALDDPYDVLGVARNATDADIGRAYRREIRRHHPDTAAGDAADDERRRQLARVQAAYALLRDAVRRGEYDRRHPGAPEPSESGVRVTVVVRRGRGSVSLSPTRAPDPPLWAPLWAGPVRWER